VITLICALKEISRDILAQLIRLYVIERKKDGKRAVTREREREREFIRFI